MNCYLCQRETGCQGNSACAICQRCGAAMCYRHLVTIQSGCGMASAGSHVLLCMLCRCPSLPLNKPGSLRQQKATTQRPRTRLFNGMRWFRKNRDTALPEPEQAVALVEQFLKQRPKP